MSSKTATMIERWPTLDVELIRWHHSGNGSRPFSRSADARTSRLNAAEPVPTAKRDGCGAKLSVMNVTKLKQHCRKFAGAVETLHGHPSNILVYSVGGKTFAYFKTSEPERWRFSFRVTPSRFLELTDMPGVKPARYMGRFHWVTIVQVHKFPSHYLVELIEESYRRALGSLSKAKQLSIAARNSQA